MLDALKGLTGGGKTQKQAEEFQNLIAAAREERSALNTMLTQITMRSSRLSQMGKTLGEVDEKTTATVGRITEVDTRVASLEGRIQTFAEVDGRIQTLLDALIRISPAFASSVNLLATFTVSPITV